MEKYLKYNSVLTNVEKVNPLFSKAKARILYTGLNRNNSYFTKESVEKSLHTIYNTPVIGEYLVEKDNFGTHGGKIEIQDDSVKYVQTTVPYGVVSSDAKIYWEDVTENDGTVREYLVVDGIYLWTGRYEELNVILEHGQMNESMEIEVVNGEFAVIDGQKTFKIDEFIFTGLCILGSDKNGQSPDEHVEPAFESANIEIVYELNNDSFKNQFNKMLTELKFSIEKQGGNDLEKDTQVNEELDFDQEVKVETEEVDTVEENPTQEVETEETQVEESPTQEESKEEVETFTKEFVEGLNAQIESLTGELNELKTYKRQREEFDLASKFADKLSVDEINEVFELSKEFSIEQVEEKLLVLFGKKNFSLTKENEKPVSKVNIQYQKDDEDYNPYKAFFSK